MPQRNILNQEQFLSKAFLVLRPNNRLNKGACAKRLVNKEIENELRFMKFLLTLHVFWYKVDWLMSNSTNMYLKNGLLFLKDEADVPIF